ncbi:hypothetical protein DIPPA_23372 [Diplonema papillatum]|nr:hypothetical protein DIPPA_23372 [Diplonema papillatum]
MLGSTATIDMEENVRLKRLEVERCHNQMVRREQELRVFEKEIEDTEKKLLSGDAAVASLTSVQNLSPEHFSDMFHRLQNHVRLQEMRNTVLSRDITDTAVFCKQMDKELESLELMNIQMQAATGYSAVRENGGRGLTQREQEVLLKELFCMQITVKKEILASRTMIIWKQNVIARLSEFAETREQTIEKQGETRNSINVKNEEIAAADEEIRDLHEEHGKTDDALVVCEERLAEMRGAPHLELDNQFLKAQAAGQLTKRRAKELAVKQQMKRLKETQDKHDAIVDSLNDLRIKRLVDKRLQGVLELPCETLSPDWDNTESGPVDVALYELLSKTKAALQDSSTVKDTLLAEKECSIRAAEEKLEAIMQDNYNVLIGSDKSLQAMEKRVLKIYEETWGASVEHREEVRKLQTTRRLQKQQYQHLVERIHTLSRQLDHPRTPPSQATPIRSASALPAPASPSKAVKTPSAVRSATTATHKRQPYLAPAAPAPPRRTPFKTVSSSPIFSRRSSTSGVHRPARKPYATASTSKSSLASPTAARTAGKSSQSSASHSPELNGTMDLPHDTYFARGSPTADAGFARSKKLNSPVGSPLRQSPKAVKIVATYPRPGSRVG